MPDQHRLKSNTGLEMGRSGGSCEAGKKTGKKRKKLSTPEGKRGTRKELLNEPGSWNTLAAIGEKKKMEQTRTGTNPRERAAELSAEKHQAEKKRGQREEQATF